MQDHDSEVIEEINQRLRKLEEKIGIKTEEIDESHRQDHHLILGIKNKMEEISNLILRIDQKFQDHLNDHHRS